ncbi:MAG: extracellular solute-binding protein [Clostridiaceae bacterium]|nr:extracellular solute-binding protein [Clostridiaceae bacterium]
MRVVKMKINKGKYIFSIALCILTFAVILAALPGCGDTGGNLQNEPYDEGAGAISPTPSAVVTPVNNDNPGKDQEQGGSAGKKVLNIYSYDEELEYIVKKYAQLHPEFDYEIRFIYTPVIDDYNTLRLLLDNLESDSDNTADIYSIPAAYASRFIKGEMSDYACTYKELGIDVENAIKKADIPQYIVDAGTNPDGEVIALPYKPYVNVFMYRRSIAREVFGTDDPDKISEIIGGGTESWDKFLQAAQTLKEYGYYIVPGCQDLSRMIDTGILISQQDSGTEFDISPDWKEFMDMSKAFFDKGYISGDIRSWGDEWVACINGKGDKKAFGTVIMLDFIDTGFALDFYLKDTAGDWGICLPPFKTADGNITGIMVNKNSPLKDELKALIEWITLDCTENGLQYLRASGTLYERGVDGPNTFEMYGGKRTVVSGTVLNNINTSLDFLGGQNINPVVYGAMRTTTREYQSFKSPEAAYFFKWVEETMEYVSGRKDKDTAVADFMQEAEETNRWYRELFGDYEMLHLLPW